ncbi:8652_t:CDS:2, partial [Cetraspora pellucida]
PNTRNISILASDRYEFAYAKQLTLSFPVPENLPTNWILCHEVLADVFKIREVLIDVLPKDKNLASIIESQEILTTMSPDNKPEERFNLSSIGQELRNHEDG